MDVLPYYFPCGLMVIGFYLGVHIDRFIGSGVLHRGPGAHVDLSVSGSLARSPSKLWKVIICKPLGGLLL